MGRPSLAQNDRGFGVEQGCGFHLRFAQRHLSVELVGAQNGVEIRGGQCGCRGKIASTPVLMQPTRVLLQRTVFLSNQFFVDVFETRAGRLRFFAMRCLLEIELDRELLSSQLAVLVFSYVGRERYRMGSANGSSASASSSNARMKSPMLIW